MFSTRRFLFWVWPFVWCAGFGLGDDVIPISASSGLLMSAREWIDVSVSVVLCSPGEEMLEWMDGVCVEFEWLHDAWIFEFSFGLSGGMYTLDEMFLLRQFGQYHGSSSSLILS